MATFLNGSLPGLTDLKMYESGILDVASAEGIALNDKVVVARDEIASGLLLFLVERSAGLVNRFLVLDGSMGLNGRPRLEQVARTPTLRQWHILQTLAVVYRDAFSNQLNDRYQRKWQEYERLAQRAKDIALQSGVGMILNPIPQPGAPTLAAASGTLAAASYFVQVTWVGFNGAEGEPSDVRALSLTAPGALQVTPPAAPAGVTGWNVYVGLSLDQLSLQFGGPLALGTPWTTPSAGLVQGKPPGDGQTPDQYYYPQQLLRRG
jgi:hypothetical protein